MTTEENTNTNERLQYVVHVYHIFTHKSAPQAHFQHFSSQFKNVGQTE